ncbi:MAG: hypothetical protein RL093_302, partial [Pseudomonadota bacterium]
MEAYRDGFVNAGGGSTRQRRTHGRQTLFSLRSVRRAALGEVRFAAGTLAAHGDDGDAGQVGCID